MTKTILTIIFTALLSQALLAGSIHTSADSLKGKHHYKLSIGSYLSHDGNDEQNASLPFWMTTNQHGIVPNANCGIAQISLYREFNPQSRKLQFSYGADIAGYTTKEDNKAIISQLYGSLRLGKLQLDLGVKHRPQKYHGLSSTNGNILWSDNSRSYPGYCFSLNDYSNMFFLPNWLTVKAEYGDYILNDDRYMGNRTRLHHKNLFFKTRLSKKISLITGLDHYCMWAGESEKYGVQPHSIKDYIKAATGAAGGEGALETDKINAIGNHIGAWSIRLEHKGNTDWTFFYSHPFEDRSGREFKNYPDGNYGIFIDTKKEKALISSLVYEFTYTKHQSGPNHERRLADGTRDILGGNDNYFDNGIYKSGYTYHNKIMGTPFFTLKAINKDGMVLGMAGARIIAHHIGIRGHIIKALNYRVKCSYIRSYGKHHAPFHPVHSDIHALTELEYTPNWLPFSINAGAAYSQYSENGKDLGCYIKIIKTGIF